MAGLTTSSKPTAANESGLPPEMQKALGRVTELGSLPEVTAKIVQVVEDPRTTARDIQEVVQGDPALATKILKIVNSAFYGLPSQVASLDRAILMLGLSAVKNLALATSITKLLKTGEINERFAARDIWTHCVAVGVAAREMAQQARYTQPDEMFVAGLVHDMGLIVMQQLYPERLREITESCHANPQDFCLVERNAFRADHQMLGGALAQRWKFPPLLRHAIAYHHEPRSLQPEFQRMAAIIFVADTLCCAAEYGYYLTAQTQELSDSILELAGLQREHLAAVMEALPARVEEAEQIFGAGEE